MPDFKMRGLPAKAPDLILDMDEEGWVYTVGRAFPLYPKLWDVCLRTDIRGGMEFFWDGTYWLSKQQFVIERAYESVTTTGWNMVGAGQGDVGRGAFPNDLDCYITWLGGAAYPAAPNGAGVYRHFVWRWEGVAGDVAGMNTPSYPQNVWTKWIATASINTRLVLSQSGVISGWTIHAEVVGAPGGTYLQFQMHYRLRAT